jgi:hypothetical protein
VPDAPNDCYDRRPNGGKRSNYLELCNYIVHSWYLQMQLQWV